MIGPWAKLSVLLGRLLVMKRPCVRYCITFTGRSAGRRERTNLVNNHRGRNLGNVVARSHMRSAIIY